MPNCGRLGRRTCTQVEVFEIICGARSIQDGEKATISGRVYPFSNKDVHEGVHGSRFAVIFDKGLVFW